MSEMQRDDFQDRVFLDSLTKQEHEMFRLGWTTCNEKHVIPMRAIVKDLEDSLRVAQQIILNLKSIIK